MKEVTIVQNWGRPAVEVEDKRSAEEVHTDTHRLRKIDQINYGSSSDANTGDEGSAMDR